MNILAIETHEVVEDLKAVGFSEDQAEAVTRIVRRSRDIDVYAMAAKADLDWHPKDTKAEFRLLRQEMKASLAEQKADFLKWMVVGAIGLQTVAILGAILTLSHALKP